MLCNDSISYLVINLKDFLIPICTNPPNPLFHFYWQYYEDKLTLKDSCKVLDLMVGLTKIKNQEMICLLLE